MVACVHFQVLGSQISHPINEFVDYSLWTLSVIDVNEPAPVIFIAQEVSSGNMILVSLLAMIVSRVSLLELCKSTYMYMEAYCDYEQSSQNLRFNEHSVNINREHML